MPIKIKRPEFRPLDKKYRKYTVIHTVITVALALVLIFGFKSLVENDGGPIGIVVMAFFTLYGVSLFTAMLLGINAYRFEDNTADLGQGILYFAGLITWLLNLRFMLITLFSSLGKDDTALKLAGSGGYNAFITDQYPSWVALIAGMIVTMVLGAFGLAKLLSYKGKK